MLSRLYRKKQMLDKALELARQATESCPGDSNGWIELGEILTAIESFEAALLALNEMEIPPPQLDPFLRKLMPGRKSLTSPSAGRARGLDVVTMVSQRLKDERSDRIPNRDRSLSEVPIRLLTDAEKRVYEVLVKILDKVGWDQFLKIRGACFVMESDVRNVDGESNLVGNDLKEDQRKGETDEDIVPRSNPTLRKKRLCKPWLDLLVINMYEDLRAWAVWHAEEQEASSRQHQTHDQQQQQPQQQAASSEVDLEQGEAEGPRPQQAFVLRSTEEISRTTRRPAIDWLRRGELARRLRRSEEAKLAFLVGMQVAERDGDTHLTSWMEALREFSNEGNITQTLMSCDFIWTFVDKLSDTSPARPYDSCMLTPPLPQIRDAVYTLVSRCGLAQVRAVLANPTKEMNRPRLESLLEDAERWGVYGYDS